MATGEPHGEGLNDRCTATAKSTGERCRQPSVPGANVCRYHGGSAGQVQKKAQERLDRMADTTTATIQDQIRDLESEYGRAERAEEKVAIMSEMRRLWKIILDRTGHGPTEKREVSGDEGGPVEITLNREVIDSGDE